MTQQLQLEIQSLVEEKHSYLHLLHVEYMEFTGIRVDREYLEKTGKELEIKISTLEKEIYEIAGCTFNISSPKQLGQILFETLEIPYPKKTKDNNEYIIKLISTSSRYI